MKKKNISIYVTIFISIISIILYLKFSKEKNISKMDEVISEEDSYNSNIMENVSYSSKDAKGNEYTVNASQGEIDYKKPNVIYLTNVQALIKLTDSNNIMITSNYGRYNSNNFDTIFSKNVIINYLENKITGEYLDFSIQRDSMIISRNVIYTNLENILKADVIEIDITTKDTKIFMFQDNKKVNIKSKD
ncbi:LPS export ABC transporter periplasmic protein LptC [Candidatus Pelagibacter sp.]|nr:LPS export ABC transporter periplasmic protein LptC [Candidatus Pelagibacter sp.]